MVEPATLSSYEWIARTYVRPALGERKVGSLRPIDLDALYSELHGRGLSARTVRICHTVLRQSLEQARRWGMIARNPAVDATPPTQGRREIEPPTVEQVQALLDAAAEEDADFAAYLWVLAATFGQPARPPARRPVRRRWPRNVVDATDRCWPAKSGVSGGPTYP